MFTYTPIDIAGDSDICFRKIFAFQNIGNEHKKCPTRLDELSSSQRGEPLDQPRLARLGGRPRNSSTSSPFCHEFVEGN